MGFVRFSRFRPGHPFRLAAVDCLPKDSLVAVPLGLERNPLAIGRPSWKTIVPSERETLHCPLAGQVIDPDDGLLAIIGNGG